MLPREVDVAIIGGGMMGSAVARELSKYKVKVAVLEKEIEVSFGQAKGSGAVHSIYGPPGSLRCKLTVESNPLFDNLAKKLGFGFKRVGEIIAALTEEEEKSVDAYVKFAKSQKIPIRKLTKDEVREMEPNITDEVVAASYCPMEGIADGFAVNIAMAENAMQNGVPFYFETEVKGLSLLPGGEDYIVETDRGNLKARYVVNAAGINADDVARMAGDDSFSVFPLRTQYFILDRRLNGLVNHNVKRARPDPKEFWRSYGWIQREVHGSILLILGAEPGERDIQEKDSEEAFSNTREGFRRALRQVQALVPSICPRDIVHMFGRVIAYPSTGDFLIKPSEKSPGLINICLQHPGLSSCPMVAKRVIGFLDELGLSLEEKSNFNPYRKPIPSLGELYDQDPRYAHVVCRCEHVSEGQIIEAIRRGAKTLDGVKFRVRAGMGRCHGGFCSPRVTKILARELNIPVEQVTKRGKRSNIVKFRTKKLLGSKS